MIISNLWLYSKPGNGALTRDGLGDGSKNPTEVLHAAMSVLVLVRVVGLSLDLDSDRLRPARNLKKMAGSCWQQVTTLD